MTAVICPECGHAIGLGAMPHEGQQMRCVECRARLEVISLSPLQLDWVYDEPYRSLEEWELETDWRES